MIIHAEILDGSVRIDFCFVLPLQSVYDFAYTAESDQLPHKFVLITNFPRRELHPTADGGPLLTELDLGRKCVLFVHEVTDD